MTPEALEKLLTEKLGMSVRRSGENLTALCPSHKESRPSWGIRIDEPHVHACFACNYKGTLRTLLIDKGWTITQVTDLLGRYKRTSKGFSLNPTTTEVTPNEEEIWPFVLEPAAVRYMRSRGIQYRTLVSAKVVYHPLDQRVLFPWYLHDKFYGATGRTIDPTNRVKIQAYFNLSKSSVVYSPAGGVRGFTQPFPLVEGEIDALKLFQAGYTNVIALGHSNVSDGQMRLLGSLPVNSDIILMFDSDQVGRRLTKAVHKKLNALGFKSVRAVDWSQCGSEEKVDPGMCTTSTLHRLIRTAKRSADWHLD